MFSIRDRRQKFFALILLLGAAALTVEVASSYVLYRHFAGLKRSFYPAGSATVALLQYLIAKAKGIHDHVVVSVDHGPVFRADPLLGYALVPGRYRITEQHSGINHRFDLTVDDAGHRVTAAVPSKAMKRLFIAGDSAMFGWGLNDAETVPWLLQTRFPDYAVVNLSLTSYSTIQSVLELKRIEPAITADDVVVLTYHPITNEFNVGGGQTLLYLRIGFERQLGDRALADSMTVPYGSVDQSGRLVVGRYSVTCPDRGPVTAQCPARQLGLEEAQRVTERAFDAVLASQRGQVILAVLRAQKNDPVVAYMRAKGVSIADVEPGSDTPDATDELAVDEHAGPFCHYMMA
ncbi:MAG: hypothetical protein M3O06_11395 [Pseudomonadota bacterium]|nr:hypothetical protein [Pseudomonadota bacterium]